MNKLEVDFHKKLLNLCEQTKEAGYNPIRFLQMINKYGSIKAAKKILLNENNIQEGVVWLWEHRRLDLSVEKLVIEPQYDKLFTKEEKEKAKKRLKKLNYL